MGAYKHHFLKNGEIANFGTSSKSPIFSSGAYRPPCIIILCLIILLNVTPSLDFICMGKLKEMGSTIGLYTCLLYVSPGILQNVKSN